MMQAQVFNLVKMTAQKSQKTTVMAGMVKGQPKELNLPKKLPEKFVGDSSKAAAI